MSLCPSKTMELLAPAGDAAAALAAFEAGADAVYAGLPKFNARERNPNFSFDSMARLIGYAHERERRVYITFNTLLKEQELPEAAEYLYRLTELQPDALIVQDLGLIKLARDFFPTLRLHASTQMGLHNSAGAALAARLGLQRIILERQVTFQELAKLREQTPLELEVFVHGALCCSLSGVCLFSSWLGGCSGNRGQCKQSCRREYTDDTRRGNFFSPADLCLLEQLPELYRMGVNSLKIEGRLRRADYVRNAVGAYRLAVDAAAAGQVLPSEALRLLQRAGGRSWSAGFTSVNAMNKVIQPDTPGVAGQPVARVDGMDRAGLKVQAISRMHRGDRVRLVAPDGEEAAFTLTDMTDERRQNTLCLHAGQRAAVKIPAKAEAAAKRGAMLYKVGESTAAATEATLAAFAPARRPLDLSIAIHSGQITVTLPGITGSPAWQAPIAILPAQKRPLQPDTVATAFAVSNAVKMCAGKMNIQLAPDIFIPAGDLKKARQEFWRWAEERISDFELNAAGADGLARFHAYYRTLQPPEDGDRQPAALWDSRRQEIPADDRRVVLPLEQWCGDPAIEVQLPFFCTENDLNDLQRRITGAYDLGARYFRVTSLFQFTLLRHCRGIHLATSLPLPAANAMAAAELTALGATRVQAWVELGQSDLTAMAAKCPVTVEQYAFGRFPVLVTRARIPTSGWIADERGQRFEVIREGKLTMIMTPGPIRLPSLSGLAQFSDYLYAAPGDEPVGNFNFADRWA